MNEDYTRKDMARWVIADAAEKIAIRDVDWQTGIFMTSSRKEAERTKLVKEALSYLSHLNQPNQPTLDELISAAHEHVANSSRPSPTDVPF